ncbi:ATP-binding protein [Clostridium sp. DL1XJH146]
MRFKRIYIKDFGIFRNEKLDNLNKNIIVIGARNGSGKTTFMKILRYIPFGIPKKNTVPPANIQYELEGELEKEDKFYNINLKGYGKPSFTDLKSVSETSKTEVFGDIDYTMYKQLYTISLDELQNSNIDKEELDSLTTILLGAGYKEIAYLPKTLSLYRKESSAIGGKSGRVTTGKFRSYNSEIKSGLDIKKKEEKKLIEYNEKKIELSKNEEENERLQKDIKDKNIEIKRLDLIKSIFPLYSSLKSIQDNLGSLNRKLNDPLNEIFEEKEEAIKKIELSTKSIEDRVNSINEEYAVLNNEKIEIEKDIEYLNPKWVGQFEKIIDVKTDMVEYKRLSNLVEEIKDLKRERQLKDNEYIKSRDEHKLLEDDLKKLKKRKNKISLDKNFFISIIILLLGIALVFFNKITGVLVIIFSIIYSLVYLFKFLNDSKNINIEEKDRKYKEIKLIISREKEAIKLLDNNITEIESGLNIFKCKFGLNEGLDYNILTDYFTSFKNLKSKIQLYEKLQQKLNLEKEKVEEDLKKMLSVIICFNEYNNEIKNNSIKDEFIKNSIQIISSFSLLYEEFQGFSNLKKQLQLKEDEYKLKNRALLEMTSSKRAIELFANYEMNLEEFMLKYYSIDDIERKILEEERNYDELKKEEKELINKKAQLSIKLEELQTTEKLVEAQRKIDKARRELSPLAKEYAKYKAAEFIIEKLQLDFLEKKKETMLRKASIYFDKITSGKYGEIIPSEDLTSLDFKTLRNDGSKIEKSENLSRGLKEQLFLSVRFNRINNLENKLPLIIDDSLVNFDEFSFKNTLEIIKELSKEHQIFILTCHSYLVEEIEKTIGEAQYFWLDEGKFNETNSRELVDMLKP